MQAWFRVVRLRGQRNDDAHSNPGHHYPAESGPKPPLPVHRLFRGGGLLEGGFGLHRGWLGVLDSQVGCRLSFGKGGACFFQVLAGGLAASSIFGMKWRQQEGLVGRNGLFKPATLVLHASDVEKQERSRHTLVGGLVFHECFVVLLTLGVAATALIQAQTFGISLTGLKWDGRSLALLCVRCSRCPS